jgi:hypothetical protein
MKTYLYISSAIIIFFVVYIFILERKLADTDKTLHQQQKESSNYKSLTDELANIQYLNWLLSDEKILNVQLISKDKSTYQLFDLIDNEKFIFYFDSNMCWPCVKKEMNNLEQLAKYCGRENILIINSGFSNRFFFNDDRFRGWDNIFITKSSIFTKKYSIQVPIIVLTNNIGDIKFAYNAPKASNIMFNTFLDFIKSRKTIN